MQASFNEMKKIKEKNDVLTNKDIENSNIFRRMVWHLSNPTVIKPLIILSTFFVLQQFTGIYTFQFHAVNMLKVLYIIFLILLLILLLFNIYILLCIYIYFLILQEVVKGVDVKFATFLFGFLRFILSFVATGMLHTYGRRPLCMMSGIIMAITLLISGFCFHLKAIGSYCFLIIIYLKKNDVLSWFGHYMSRLCGVQ